jgi:hypothetical protein
MREAMSSTDVCMIRATFRMYPSARAGEVCRPSIVIPMASPRVLRRERHPIRPRMALLRSWSIARFPIARREASPTSKPTHDVPLSHRTASRTRVIPRRVEGGATCRQGVDELRSTGNSRRLLRSGRGSPRPFRGSVSLSPRPPSHQGRGDDRIVTPSNVVPDRSRIVVSTRFPRGRPTTLKVSAPIRG